MCMRSMGLKNKKDSQKLSDSDPQGEKSVAWWLYPCRDMSLGKNKQIQPRTSISSMRV